MINTLVVGEINDGKLTDNSFDLLKKFPSYKKYKSITSMFIPGYKLVKK